MSARPFARRVARRGAWKHAFQASAGACGWVALAAMLSQPTVVRAATSEPARLRFAAALIDDVIRGVLPVELVVPGPVGGSTDGGVGAPALVAAITELKYCGVTDGGAGRFRAVIRSGPFGVAGAPILLGDDGCRQSLSDLARRAPAGGVIGDIGASTVADLEAVWRPWELRLILVRTNTPGPPRPGPPLPLGALENRSELLMISTAGYRLLPSGADSRDAITVHAAPVFAADSVEVLGIWGDGGSGPPALRPSTSGPAAPALSAGVNASADLPLGLVNQILRHMTSTQPLPIRIDRDTVDLQNLSMTGGAGSVGSGTPAGGLTLTGLGTPRSLRETVRITVQTGGNELRVISVRIDAQQESCAGLGSLATAACNTRNAGRNAAAAAFGTAATHRYQGQLVRDLAGPQDLRVELGTRRLQLGGNLAHVGPGARGLAFGARLSRGSSDH